MREHYSLYSQDPFDEGKNNQNVIQDFRTRFSEIEKLAQTYEESTEETPDSTGSASRDLTRQVLDFHKEVCDFEKQAEDPTTLFTLLYIKYKLDNILYGISN